VAFVWYVVEVVEDSVSLAENWYVGAAVIVMESAWSSVSGVPWESVTLTVKLDVPVAEGVPEIVPVELPRDNPAGSEPLITDQLYGVMPPVAARVWLYAAPSTPFGTLVVVITRSAGGLITIESAWSSVSGVP
jgi:hypothetical protein